MLDRVDVMKAALHPGTGRRRRFELAAFAFAAASIPATKMALMFWEYRLHLPLARFTEAAALLLALAAATLAAITFSRTWGARLLRVAAVLIWSAFAYLAVALVPGCLWAPACL